MAFNIDDPPETFKKFRRQVIESVEEADVTSDEQYPIALFLVTRENTGAIVELEEVLEEYDIDGDTELQYIMQAIYPNIAKQAACRYFGIVFPGQRVEDFEEEELSEIVIVFTGSINDIDMSASEVERDEEYDCATLGPWEKVNLEGFSEIVVPFRRAVTLQG